MSLLSEDNRNDHHTVTRGATMGAMTHSTKTQSLVNRLSCACVHACVWGWGGVGGSGAYDMHILLSFAIQSSRHWHKEKTRSTEEQLNDNSEGDSFTTTTQG